MISFLHEFWLFGLKQASAAIFGGALLAAILLTEFWYPFEGLHRFDALFLWAVLVQVFLIAFRLEELREVAVIVVFHLVASLMEIFKTSEVIGSWSYPGVEGAKLAILGVPLFAGFMYSAVGSYIARIWRIFEMEFCAMPPFWVGGLIALLIYLNFFSHHFLPDIRVPLSLAILVLYGRSFILFKVSEKHRPMPYVLGMLLVAFFIWIAENVSTFGSVWLYPVQQSAWQLVPLSKMIAWFLLLKVSFTLVALVHNPERKW